MKREINHSMNNRTISKIAKNCLLLAVLLLLFSMVMGCSTIVSTPEHTISSAPSNPDVLEIVYFHRTQRCAGCIYAESGTRFTLENYFAEELESEKVVFKVINLGDKTNATIVEHYGAYTSSLFINSIKGDMEHIEEVEEIWFFLGKDREFVTIVKSKIDRYLSEEKP